jgi:DNA-binding NarL/FixJ family response regulator
VVDDHPLVCEGLADLINRQSDVACCGSAGDIPAAHQAVAAANPDLVVVDLRLGGDDGLDLIKALRAGDAGLRMLALSQFDEFVYAERALRAGAHGYVSKAQAADELLNAIRKVLAGQTYVSQKIAAGALRRMIEEQPRRCGSEIGVLSGRELQVLKSIAAGQSTREIAAELGLSTKTIETHREHLKYKLGLSSAAELAGRAAECLHQQAEDKVVSSDPDQIPSHKSVLHSLQPP